MQRMLINHHQPARHSRRSSSDYEPAGPEPSRPIALPAADSATPEAPRLMRRQTHSTCPPDDVPQPSSLELPSRPMAGQSRSSRNQFQQRGGISASARNRNCCISPGGLAGKARPQAGPWRSRHAAGRRRRVAAACSTGCRGLAGGLQLSFGPVDQIPPHLLGLAGVLRLGRFAIAGWLQAGRQIGRSKTCCAACRAVGCIAGPIPGNGLPAS